MHSSPGVDAGIRALSAALVAAVPASAVALRGSRAAGTADEYSDVDLDWQVGASGSWALETLPSALHTVGAVESLRLDPDDDRGRRLVFVRFTAWSVFHRVDLEVHGDFRPAPPSWDLPWSAAESALMNAVAAVKAARRGRGDVDGLLTRGAARIGETAPVGSVTERVSALVTAAVRAEPAQRLLGDRVLALLR
ncbi:hypothetical protein [Curtobacterium sp. 9128]|uniref:hypothetical protein n=1 Tax=Curtobacterium sp. 9128 TaxID=1793722 RepID=UPI0011A53A1C|nr:hypothetical protein [Curtobacterium sp. 9128]